MVLRMRMWVSGKDLEVLQRSMLRALLIMTRKSMSSRMSRGRERLHRWKKTLQSTNRWRRLNSLNPQGIHKEWLAEHSFSFWKRIWCCREHRWMISGFLESKDRAPRRLWKLRDDNGIMFPDDIEELFRIEKKKSSISPKQGLCQECRQASRWKQRKTQKKQCKQL